MDEQFEGVFDDIQMSLIHFLEIDWFCQLVKQWLTNSLYQSTCPLIATRDIEPQSDEKSEMAEMNLEYVGQVTLDSFVQTKAKACHHFRNRSAHNLGSGLPSHLLAGGADLLTPR